MQPQYFDELDNMDYDHRAPFHKSPLHKHFMKTMAGGFSTMNSPNNKKYKRATSSQQKAPSGLYFHN